MSNENAFEKYQNEFGVYKLGDFPSAAQLRERIPNQDPVEKARACILSFQVELEQAAAAGQTSWVVQDDDLFNLDIRKHILEILRHPQFGYTVYDFTETAGTLLIEWDKSS